MIRMPEGRLTLQVPRQPSSLVMSGEIVPNLSPLLLKSPSLSLWGRGVQIPAHLSPTCKSQEKKSGKKEFLGPGLMNQTLSVFAVHQVGYFLQAV